MERPSDGSEPLVDKPSFISRMFKDWDKSMSITVAILLTAIITLIFILIFCFLGEVDPECSKTIPTDYKDFPIKGIEGNFLFNDDISDFFLDTQLNESKWFDFGTTFLGSRIGKYFFASNNVKVKDGCLRLSARKLKESESTNEENKYRGFTKFATSIVKSIKKVKYGYFEIKAKAMNVNVINAFWLYDPLSDNLTAKFSKGDYSEEIDIFKLVGTHKNENGSYYYNTTVHKFNTPYVEAMIVDEEEIDGNKHTNLNEKDFYSEFHTWGFLWNEANLTWYLDGKQVFIRDNDNGTFTRPLHVTFDSEAIENTILDDTKEFKIDYFKYWELKK